MIPISEDNPSHITPVVNVLLIIACILVYVWELTLGHEMEGALDVLGFSPVSLFDRNYAPSLQLGISPIVTIFISMFLHGSILHIAGNMLYLWIFGNNIEGAMGHVRYIIFYLASGVAAAMTMTFADPSSHVPMVGASGAISGVLAAYILLFPRARVTVIIPLGIILWPLRLSAVWVVGLWFLTQLVTAALTDPSQPGVAWWAHVGGFVAGLIMTPFFKSSRVPYFGPLPTRGPWGR
jgi:membrane associated rhomboid family serine protease